MAGKKKNSLIGKWFAQPSKNENGEICGLGWRGDVLDEVAPGRFLVQLYSGLDGSATNQRIIAVDDMKDWVFYDSEDELASSTEHGEVRRWVMLHERRSATRA